MEKIVVLRDKSQEDQLLVSCLGMLFPECEIDVVPKSTRASGDCPEESIYFDCQEKRGEDG